MNFYKYKALCKGEGIDPCWQIEEFLQQKVYFNGLGAFNDPFERHFKIQHVSVEL